MENIINYINMKNYRRFLNLYETIYINFLKLYIYKIT